jgi:beta-glucosidase-like glycosyl hydrolase
LTAGHTHPTCSPGVSAADETTKFAFPITMGMSFNRTMWKKSGQQIGREARALRNLGQTGSTFWAPVINLAREPRWGRNIEVGTRCARVVPGPTVPPTSATLQVPGEDPFHVGEYAEGYVTGFQQAEEDPTHLLASACCKHYAANSMDNSTVAGETHTRHDFSAAITQQDLVDTYNCHPVQHSGHVTLTVNC